MTTALALPVTLGPDGMLVRGDPADAVAELVGVMATTSQRFWPHAPWFGLLELFEGVRPDVQEHPRIADALNTALRELGVEELTVETVRTVPATFGQRAFDLVLRRADGTVLFRQAQG